MIILRSAPINGNRRIEKNIMPIPMNQILTECTDQAYETARLRRNGFRTTHERVLAELLAELEASGDAMRFVTGKGQIAWKVTPRLRDYLMDLQLDAKADLEDL